MLAPDEEPPPEPRGRPPGDVARPRGSPHLPDAERPVGATPTGLRTSRTPLPGRAAVYITTRLNCLTFSMYFSKKKRWMSIMFSSRPWI